MAGHLLMLLFCLKYHTRNDLLSISGMRHLTNMDSWERGLTQDYGNEAINATVVNQTLSHSISTRNDDILLQLQRTLNNVNI